MILLYAILGIAGLLVISGTIATLRIIFYPSHIKKKTGIGSIFELDITKVNIKSADNVRLLSPDQIEKIQKGDY